MPRFETEVNLGRTVPDVFDFLGRTANLVAVAAPDLRLRLVEGPERLHLGARITLKGRRWGVPHRVVSEITAWEPNALIVEEQRQGSFGRWTHAQRLEAVSGGARVRDELDYEPPGGLLGLTVTAAFLAKDLERVFAYRAGKLRELLGVISV
jgi:ligand-binding SRPBCC domain-containing protein